LLGIWKFAALSIILWVPLIQMKRERARDEAGTPVSLKAFSLDRPLAACLLFLALAGNLFSIGLFPHDWIIRLDPALSGLGLHQSWTMFTNKNLRNPAKIEFIGSAESGPEQILPVREITLDPTLRWYNYLGAIENAEPVLVNRLARYICGRVGGFKKITVVRIFPNRETREELGYADCTKEPGAVLNHPAQSPDFMADPLEQAALIDLNTEVSPPRIRSYSRSASQREEASPESRYNSESIA
jgi:hypothetical protein